MKKLLSTAAAGVILGLASQANAATVMKTDDTKVDVYGYVKVDLRHVSGDIAYRDFWIGNAPYLTDDISTTRFNVKETRLGFKVMHDDILAVVEMDYYGGTGTQAISNSDKPRIRHAYIKAGNWMIGQNWSTFMPLHTLAETLDFGGAHVGESFLRQGQVRYTNNGFSFAIENSETLGGSGESDESMVDFIGRYDTNGDWGQMSASLLARQVDPSGIDETGMAVNVAAKFNVGAKNDFKVAVTAGEYGRYAGTVAVPGVAVNSDGETVVEEGVSITASYRHFWNDSVRTTIYYGNSTTDVGDRDRSHWGVNLIKQHSAKLKYGVEIGSYAVNETFKIENDPTITEDDVFIVDPSSTYFQLSAQLSF
jgi:hypothetical protein